MIWYIVTRSMVISLFNRMQYLIKRRFNLKFSLCRKSVLRDVLVSSGVGIMPASKRFARALSLVTQRSKVTLTIYGWRDTVIHYLSEISRRCMRTTDNFLTSSLRMLHYKILRTLYPVLSVSYYNAVLSKFTILARCPVCK